MEYMNKGDVIMNEELKNCPFCGNKAECKISAKEQSFNVIVRCTNCGVSMSESLAKEVTVDKLQSVVNLLAYKWNARPLTIKNYNDEQLKITYMQSRDAIVTWVNGESTSFSLDRTRLKEAIAEYDKQHIEAQKGEWWSSNDGFKCNKCNYESRYMFTKCPGCKRTMKNGTEGV